MALLLSLVLSQGGRGAFPCTPDFIRPHQALPGYTRLHHPSLVGGGGRMEREEDPLLPLVRNRRGARATNRSQGLRERKNYLK